MSDIVILCEGGELKGRYSPRIEAIAEGEIELTYPGPGILNANHTRLPEAMGGRGATGARLSFMLEDACKTGFMIGPVCSHGRGQYAKHPEWSGLFTTRPGEDP